ncbi:hypothetical protein HN011_004295, partial [Eciton burchellii]
MRTLLRYFPVAARSVSRRDSFENDWIRRQQCWRKVAASRKLQRFCETSALEFSHFHLSYSIASNRFKRHSMYRLIRRMISLGRRKLLHQDFHEVSRVLPTCAMVSILRRFPCDPCISPYGDGMGKENNSVGIPLGGRSFPKLPVGAITSAEDVTFAGKWRFTLAFPSRRTDVRNT